MQTLAVAINGTVKNKDAGTGSLTVDSNKGVHQIHVGFNTGIGENYRRVEEAQVSIWVDGARLWEGSFDELKKVLAPTASEKPKVLIILDQGNIQNIACDSEINLTVIDWDNLRAGDSIGQDLYPVQTMSTDLIEKNILINKQALITDILKWREQEFQPGLTLSEGHTSEIKEFVKTIPVPGDGRQKLIEQIQLLFPIEYAEAMDEVNKG